ncbi:MAG TPA: FmdB family zinc ribbon protein [Actinomycetota bacterium]|nr:FmdB family zinc ribbon protein [Actinomycetota bacterium]
MPTYEYACRSCKRHTEAVQSFTDPPLTECPHCGGELKRVFHPVGIVLKGSGFYSTDNRSSSKTKLATGKDTSTDSAGESPATDTSSAKKAEPAAKESKPAKKESKKTETKK